MTPRASGLVALALFSSVSCGYYNGMWSANRLASQARRQERQGRTDEARASWAQAAVKAESVAVRRPHGRWADDARVLEGEGLAKSGACDRATVILDAIVQSDQQPARRERAALAAAECRLDAAHVGRVEALLLPVTHSPDRGRASRAAYLAGRAADLRGDPLAAVEWYGRSAEREAGVARTRALLAAARIADALALADSLTRGRFDEASWMALLGSLGEVGGPGAASRTLDRLLGAKHIPGGSRARLLLADGDRLFAAQALTPADDRYRQVIATAPDSTEGQRAVVRRLRIEAARAASVADLQGVQARLDHLVRAGGPGAATADVRALQELLRRVLDAADWDSGLPFQPAELAQDSLRAPLLAASMFLTFARARPASLFAPKALLAAAALAPDQRDSVVGVLQTAYASSPYARALRGEPSPAYSAAEDSLARALGGGLERPGAFSGSLVAPPVPGPRGPPFDVAAPERPDLPKSPGAAPRPGDEPSVPGGRRRPPVQ